MRLLRIKDVENKTGLKKTSIYRMIKKGTFPLPVRLGHKVSAWPEDEVDAVIRAWINGASEDDIRSLVERLKLERNYSETVLASSSR